MRDLNVERVLALNVGRNRIDDNHGLAISIVARHHSANVQ